MLEDTVSSNVREVVVYDFIPLAKKNSKFQALTTQAKGSKGKNIKRPGLPKTLATQPVLQLETNKGKDILTFYKDQVMLEVNEQLVGADEMSVEVLMVGMLKEITRGSMESSHELNASPWKTQYWDTWLDGPWMSNNQQFPNQVDEDGAYDPTRYILIVEQENRHLRRRLEEVNWRMSWSMKWLY
uniref:Uncharacterized protein n=1 Tax=Cannabis sativa TaxID=3483 RepID=A0A803PCS4_CANSA